MERRSGTVVSFDDPAGYGAVADGEGGEWFFHCTAIADGSRTVEVGATVAFEIVAGRNGQWEATDLRVVGETPSRAQA